jgi:hypothetical protein
MATFERPKKGDLDRTLSGVMHDARHKVEAECSELISQAVSRGTLQSSRQNLLFFLAADRQHERVMRVATAIVLDFIEHADASPPDMAGWARPILENLGNALLTVPKPNGFPEEHRRLLHQYQAVFRQRLDHTLRDIEIGYIRGQGFLRPQAVDGEQWISAAVARRDVVTVERSLEEHPQDVREAARALSKAIGDQIDELNASRLNDPDALDRQGAFIAFLRQIAMGLDDLASSLEAVIEADSPEIKQSKSANAATVARGLASFVREGFDKHRAAVQTCGIQVPVLTGSVWLLHAFGVDATAAFTGVCAIMGLKTIFKDEKKE